MLGYKRKFKDFGKRKVIIFSNEKEASQKYQKIYSQGKSSNSSGIF
jgi:hypothetical protein